MCDSRSKHKQHLTDGEEFFSPAFYLEGLLTTLVVDACEEQDVATFYIPGTYLHADIPK